MRKLLTGSPGAIGAAALWRFLRAGGRAGAAEPRAGRRRIRPRSCGASSPRRARRSTTATSTTPPRARRSTRSRSRARSRSGAARSTSRHRRPSTACSRRSRTSRHAAAPAVGPSENGGILFGMSELPRTDDPPLDAEGVDTERVEEAFAAFGERVRELESVAGELRAELRALRAERAAPAPPRRRGGVAGRRRREPGPAPDWVAAVPPPLSLPSAAPRLVAEAAFLVVVALLAGLADLSAAWIAVIMLGGLGARRPLRVGGGGEARPLAPRGGPRRARPRPGRDASTRPAPGTCRSCRRPRSRRPTPRSRAPSSPSLRLSRTAQPETPADTEETMAPRAAGDRSAAAVLAPAAGRDDAGPLGGVRAVALARGRGGAPRPGRVGASPRSRPGAAAGLRRRALRERAEAADGARLRPGRPALRDAGDRRGRRGRPRLERSPGCSRAASRLRSASPGSGKRSSSQRRARCTGSSSAASASSPGARS